MLLEHSSHIAKVSVEATYFHFNPWYILKEKTKPAGPFGTMPDHVIQLNYGEVHTHASYKTTRTWENFNNQGTKILFSDKLWLVANNSKSFVNRSKSMIRNNLGLCKQ